MIITIRPHVVGGLLNRHSTFVRNSGNNNIIFSPIIIWEIKAGDIELLVDVGTYSPSMAFENGHNNYKEAFFRRVNEIIQKKKNKLDAIILTHMHWDHASGITDISDKIPIIVQKLEVKYSLKPGIEQEKFYDFLCSKQYVEAKRYELIDGDYKINEFLKIIHLPGHTPGSQGLVIEGGVVKILIAGDTVPLFENWYSATKHINNICYDEKQYYNSFDKISSINPVVIPSHDSMVLNFFESYEAEKISKRVKEYFNEINKVRI